MQKLKEKLVTIQKEKQKKKKDLQLEPITPTLLTIVSCMAFKNQLRKDRVTFKAYNILKKVIEKNQKRSPKDWYKDYVKIKATGNT